ncbi:MAG: glycosyltransferase family 2 protein, partial [Chloroflexota bacterium]
MDPQITVAMPTYNQAAFIQRALRSLCDQAYQAWELIIVDDASTDGTPELIRPYLDDERIRYIRLPENQGRGAATN